MSTQLDLFAPKRKPRRSLKGDERKLMASLRRVPNSHFARPFEGVLGPNPSRAAIKRLMTPLPKITVPR